VPVAGLPACPVCGNGLVEFPETCDTLGTPQSCDGCSRYCQLEVCDDANVCTVDSCSPVLGCRNAARPDGTDCSDGLVCNGTGETCLAGVCRRTPPDCDDHDPCTIDTCVEPTGCTHAQAAPQSICSDGN